MTSCSYGAGVILPPEVTPQQGVTVITTGGAGVQTIPAGAYGGYIWNPLEDSDQGVTAEPLYVNPLGLPDLQGFGSTIVLAPGDYYMIAIARSSMAVWANAATSGHRFTSVYWVGP